MEFEIFDSIRRFTIMIRAQMMCVNLRDIDVTVIIANRDCNPLGAPLSPLLAIIGVLLGTLDGEAGWCLSMFLAPARDKVVKIVNSYSEVFL
jgi:hypothetical protein